MDCFLPAIVANKLAYSVFRSSPLVICDSSGKSYGSEACVPRDGIFGHHFNKKLESFAPCYWQFLPLADFKISSRNKKTRVYAWIAFCKMEKWRVENQTNTRVWEDSSLCPETFPKNAVQEFHLWTHLEKMDHDKFLLHIHASLLQLF